MQFPVSGFFNVVILKVTVYSFIENSKEFCGILSGEFNMILNVFHVIFVSGKGKIFK